MKIRQQQRWLAPTPVVVKVDKSAIPRRRKATTKATNENAAMSNRFDRRPRI